MYLYRSMSSDELINRINGINKNKAAIKGINTFKYDNKDYIHFFKFAEHAFLFQKKFDYAVVAKIALEDELTPPLEYGFYSNIKTYYDDSLYGYAVPLPEIILDRELFSDKNIIQFSNINNGNFSKKENGEHERNFWVENKKILSNPINQMWTMDSIYYEYIKILSKKFDYDMSKVVSFLKTIDIDEELDKLANNVQKKKIITRK